MKEKVSDDSILFVGTIAFIISMIIMYFLFGPEGIFWMSYLIFCPLISGIIALISIFVYVRYFANKVKRVQRK
jgi:fatty-acid desaturase